MKALETMIPYCEICSRKVKKDVVGKNQFYCDVVIDTPMKGIVTSDTDGTCCVELGVYKPIQQNN
jgi:hypothetical protein